MLLASDRTDKSLKFVPRLVLASSSLTIIITGKFLVKATILLFQNVIIQAQTYQDVDRLTRDKSSCKSASRVYTT